jgi:hypothetical protein
MMKKMTNVTNVMTTKSTAAQRRRRIRYRNKVREL